MKQVYTNDLLSGNNIGIRLRQLRDSKGWTQEESSAKLAAFLDSNEKLSIQTLCAYEMGRRIPTLVTLVAFAELYNVSLDYLVGLKPQKQREETENEKIEAEVGPKLVHAQYPKFDRKPVYVRFPDGTMEDGWAIMDHQNKRLIFANQIIQYTSKVELYAAVPDDIAAIHYNAQKPLSISGVMRASLVWVSSYSFDRETKGKYTGYYRHAEDHSCLINQTNGLTLPYTGLGISYGAFSVEE